MAKYLDANGVRTLSDNFVQNNTLSAVIEGIDKTYTSIGKLSSNNNIISFDDAEGNLNLKDLEITLNPIQEGKGDPYPPGGGKNLFDISAFTSTTEVNVSNIDLTTGAATIEALVTSNIYGDVRYTTTLKAGTYTLSGTVSSSASGAVPRIMIAKTSDGATIAFIDNTSSSFSFTLSAETNVIMIARLNQSQSISIGDRCTTFNVMLRFSDADSTFAPYSNIRSISSVTSVRVTLTGHNLWGGAEMLNAIRNANVGASFNGTKVTLYANSGMWNYPFAKGFFRENTQYTFVFSYDATAITISNLLNLKVVYTDETVDRLDRQNGAAIGTRIFISKPNKTIASLQGDMHYARTTFDSALCGIFEGAVTADGFEPYQGQTVAVSLTDGADPLTVYGGTLDVTTGELSVTHRVVDLGTLPWNYFQINDVFFTTFANDSAFGTRATGFGTDCLCDIYKGTNILVSKMANNQFVFNSSDISAMASVTVKDTRFTDAIEFQASLSGHILLYPLASSVTYQLTPAQISTLNNFNSITINTGIISNLEYYKKDTDLTEIYKDLQHQINTLKSLVPYMELYKSVSGNPATFNDGSVFPVRDISVTITPTQSGSGDPYPPGGGKNLLDASSLDTIISNGITFTVLKNAVGNVVEIDANGTSTADKAQIYFTVPDGSIYSGMILSGCPGGSGSYFVIEKYSSPYTEYIKETGDGAIIPTIADGEKCTILWRFPTAGTVANHAKCYPMIRRASDTDPTFAPYSNIRPISGASSVSVTRTGKNLWGGNKMLDDFASVPNASISGTKVTYNAGIAAGSVFSKTIKFKENTSYTFILSYTTATHTPLINVLVRFTDGTQVRLTKQNNDANMNTGVTVYTSPANKTVAYLGDDFHEGNTTLDSMLCGIFEGVVTADDFEPYQIQTVTVQLTDGSDPLTVYGGTLNVTTGELTVTHVSYDVDGASIGGASDSDLGNNIRVGIYRFPTANAQGKNCPIISNYLPTVPYSWTEDLTGICFYDTTGVYVKLPKSILGTPDIAGAKAYLTAHPLRVVYPIAAPLTYQLTTAQLATLSGYNSVTTDADTLSVEYRADPMLSLNLRG